MISNRVGQSKTYIDGFVIPVSSVKPSDKQTAWNLSCDYTKGLENSKIINKPSPFENILLTQTTIVGFQLNGYV